MILWFDCETTGFDERKGSILEVALIITDNDLNEIARYDSIIHQTQLTLDLTLDDWTREQHARSGLSALVLSSTKTTEAVEREMIALVQSHCPTGSRAILAGNTIHFDRKFLRSDMPAFEQLLDTYTHRMTDVSSFKEAFDRHFSFKPSIAPSTHRALPDIETSIAEYQQYLSCINMPKVKRS